MNESKQVQEKEALTIQTRSHTLMIVDQDSYSEANDFTVQIKVRRQFAANIFKPIKDKAREAVQEVQKQWDKIDGPLREAEETFKKGMSVFYRQQQEKKRLAQEALDLAAKKLAQKAIDDQEELKKEREKKAKKAIESGDMEEYERIVHTPVEEIRPPLIDNAPLPGTVTMSKGSSIKKNWKFEILDERRIPEKFKSIDRVKIGKYVRAMKEDAAIPGVRVYSDDSMAISTKE